MDAPLIRHATPADADAIAAIMREAMSENVRRLTILGSPRLARWVAAQLASDAADTFFAAAVDGQFAGMASWRQIGATLVLNHLHVRPEFRGHGLARALMAAGLGGAAESVAVDVFGESAVAREWYRRLGFAVDYRRLWLEATLPTPAPDAPRAWSVSGFDAAEEAQTRQGFSHFKLTTTRGEYAIGRLAAAVFRCAGCGILADAEALAALATLDAERVLVCIATPEELSPAVLARMRVVEESERLVIPRTRLVAALGIPATGD